ncbi:MAG: class I tRNA ligase family protein, partial [Burkholderiaceae bacterium]
IDGIALEPLLEKRATGLRRPETAPRVKKDTAAEFPNGIPGFGADALRFTFCSLATLGRNIAFDSKRCEGYRNFCNKLWNATKFVLMNCEGQDCGLLEGDKTACPPGYNKFSQADRWITSELQRAEAAVAQGFAEYRLDNVANAIYQFVWDEYCDWYIEIAKAQLTEAKNAGDAAAARGTRRTLIRTLETVLRLMHPVTPFVTAELWETVAPIAGRAPAPGQTIATAAYPVAQLERIDEAACAWVAKLKLVVAAVRNLRKEMNLTDVRVPLLTHGDAAFVAEIAPILKMVAKVSEVQVIADEAAFTQATTMAPVAVQGDIRLALHVEIDVGAEKERLSKEITRLEAEVVKANNQLGNENFVSRAKPEVVEQLRTRLAGFIDTVARMKAQREQLGG